VLGVFGDPAVTGKPAGDDLREGKRTYLIAAAIEQTGPAAFDEHLGDPELDEHGVVLLRKTIVESGALRRTEERIAHLTATALEALAAADITAEAREVLTGLARAATQRTV
jgi:geranylgeranyl diphosphate synthase type I